MSDATTPTSPATTPGPDAPPALRVISAARAIALARRWLRVAVGFRVLMFVAVASASAWGFSRGFGVPVFGAAAMLWLVVSFAVVGMSVRSRRLADDAAPLIAAGALDVAEDRLSEAMSSFSVIRSPKLIGLQQLALLRAAQARWPEAAALSRELLSRRRGGRERALETPGRLVLAESALELGELRTAHAQLAALQSADLGLRETLHVLLLRLEFLARTDQPAEILAGARQSLDLLELLPPAWCARGHALLAWAAKRGGRAELAALCVRRVHLLGDVDALVAQRPFLAEALRPMQS